MLIRSMADATVVIAADLADANNKLQSHPPRPRVSIRRHEQFIWPHQTTECLNT